MASPESFRSFSPALENIASRWRSEIVSTLPWEVVPSIFPEGESKVFMVRTAGLEGYGKPGIDEPPATRHPRAAQEKIAADLAFDLGLPVPPVVLWERKDVASGQPRHVALSIQPFTPPNTWRMIRRVAGLAARLLPWLSRASSTMAAFDTWLANADRTNPANLLVAAPNGGEGKPSLAFIDFANALAYAWSRHGTGTSIVPIRCYPHNVPVDLASMAEATSRIERLPSQVIEEVVERIPRAFLSEQHKKVIVEGLIHRQRHLRTALQKAYPELLP